MVSKINRVFVDTCAFKALMDDRDGFNDDASEIIGNLIDRGDELVTSNYVIDECMTLLRTKCGRKNALKLREFLLDSEPTINIVRVKMSDEAGAWKWFEKDWSKLSFTDCVTFAQMKRLGINRVFGFDKHFERAGFKLEKKIN